MRSGSGRDEEVAAEERGEVDKRGNGTMVGVGGEVSLGMKRSRDEAADVGVVNTSLFPMALRTRREGEEG